MKEKKHKSKDKRFKVDTDDASNSMRPEVYEQQQAKRGDIHTYKKHGISSKVR